MLISYEDTATKISKMLTSGYDSDASRIALNIVHSMPQYSEEIGHWQLLRYYRKSGLMSLRCSVCGNEAISYYDLYKSCPTCKATMDLDKTVRMSFYEEIND